MLVTCRLLSLETCGAVSAHCGRQKKSVRIQSFQGFKGFKAEGLVWWIQQPTVHVGNESVIVFGGTIIPIEPQTITLNVPYDTRQASRAISYVGGIQRLIPNESSEFAKPFK